MAWKRKQRSTVLPDVGPAPSPRLALFALLVVTGLLFDIGSLPAAAFSEGRITSSGFDGQEAQIVASAVARFRHDSLDLPAIHLRRSGGAGDCTRRGWTADTWPVVYITICEVEEEVVVHELAHAWSFAHLGTEDEIEWNHRRGVPTWLSRQEPWELRGSEHVADILTWYLYWSDSADSRWRIGGDNTAALLLADVEWLLTNGEAPDALDVYTDRATLIRLAFAAAP